MANVTEADIKRVLSGVIDPDRKADIVSLGMVTGVIIKDGHVSFAIEVDAERGPKLEPLRKAAEQAVHDLPGVLTVAVALTAQRPAHGSGQGAGPAIGHGRPGAKTLLPGVGAVIAIASGKGGVGKSTTSANLALALSKQGLKVGLFDADVFGPSQPRMLGIKGEPVSDGKILYPMEGHGIKCMSMGFLVEEETPVIWRGPMVMGAIQQLLGDVQWGELDVLLIDMPPGTGDVQLTISQSVPLTGAVIVSTPQDIALLDARKGINMFLKTEVPILGIIENMSTYICPKCGHEDHIFGHGGAKAEAAKLAVDFLGEIPLDISIRLAGDEGAPIVVSVPEGPHAAAYGKIAAQLWQKVMDIKGEAKKIPKISFQ